MLFDVAIESCLLKKTAAYIRFRCIKKDVTGFMVPVLVGQIRYHQERLTWKKHEVATKIQKRYKALYKKKGYLKTSGGAPNP